MADSDEGYGIRAKKWQLLGGKVSLRLEIPEENGPSLKCEWEKWPPWETWKWVLLTWICWRVFKLCRLISPAAREELVSSRWPKESSTAFDTQVQPNIMRLVREHFRESKGVEPWLQVPPLDVPENWWFYCFWSLSLGQANPELCWWWMVHGCFFRTGSDGIFRRFAILPGKLDMIARYLGWYNLKDENAYVSTHGAHGNFQRPHKISTPNIGSIKESSERDFILVRYH